MPIHGLILQSVTKKNANPFCAVCLFLDILNNAIFDEDHDEMLIVKDIDIVGTTGLQVPAFHRTSVLQTLATTSCCAVIQYSVKNLSPPSLSDCLSRHTLKHKPLPGIDWTTLGKPQNQATNACRDLS